MVLVAFMRLACYDYQMGLPFKKVFADEPEASISKIRALVGACQERRQTGIIRLRISEDQLGYLFIKRGVVVNSHFVSPGVLETVAAEKWDTQIKSIGNTYPRFISLSTQGLQICKLLIQSVARQAEAITQTADLDAYFETQKKNANPLLAHLERETSEGAVLFSGSPELQHSIFVSPDTVYDDAGITPLITNAESQHDALTVYEADYATGAWQEYFLRRAFANICEQTLYNLQTLTGRSVVDSLNRLITAFASRKNLSIGIVSRKVMDDEFFTSPEQAADAYRLLLNEMFERITGIAGSHLLVSTLRKVNDTLPDHERSVVADFSLFPNRTHL